MTDPISHRVLLLRHGRTPLNAAGALRGRIDAPLDDTGLQEVRALAGRVATGYRLTRLYSSPLERARATAQAIGDLAGLAVVDDERFIDVDYAAWAGRPPQELAPGESALFLAWQRDPSVPLPGAESPRAVLERAMGGLRQLAQDADGDIAIVSHDAVLQLLLTSLLGLDLRGYRGLTQHTATLNELSNAGGELRVCLLNSAWHLVALAGF